MSDIAQWVRVLHSTEVQLDHLNELPTNPSAQQKTSLQEVQARFDAAVAKFRANPSLEHAVAVDEIAPWLIKKAAEMLQRPSGAFQDIVARTKAVLIEVRDKAREHAH